MLKKILGLVTASVAALSILTGCTTANTSSGSALVSVSRVKQFVIPDKTTLAETRELLGTPIFFGKTAYGKDFACFSFIGERGTGEAVGKAMAHILSFGIAKDKEQQFVQKNVYVIYDQNNIVKEIHSYGYAGIYYHGWFTQALLALRPLSEKELNENINYSKQYIIDSWKDYIVKEIPADVERVALDKNVPIEQLNYDEVFYNFAGIPDIAVGCAQKLFKQFTIEKMNKVTGRENGDGSKLELVLGD